LYHCNLKFKEDIPQKKNVSLVINKKKYPSLLATTKDLRAPFFFFFEANVFLIMLRCVSLRETRLFMQQPDPFHQSS